MVTSKKVIHPTITLCLAGMLFFWVYSAFSITSTALDLSMPFFDFSNRLTVILTVASAFSLLLAWLAPRIVARVVRSSEKAEFFGFLIQQGLCLSPGLSGLIIAVAFAKHGNPELPFALVSLAGLIITYPRKTQPLPWTAFATAASLAFLAYPSLHKRLETLKHRTESKAPLIWTETANNDRGFALSFPGTPMEVQANAPGPFGTFDVHTLSLEIPDRSMYKIQYARVQGDLDANKINALFDNVRDASIRAAKARNMPVEISSDKPTTFEGFPARDLVLHPKSFPTLRMRMVFANQHIYSLMQTTVDQTENTNQFFDSFHLMKATSNKKSGATPIDVVGTWHVDKVVCSSNHEQVKFYNRVYFTFTSAGKFISRNPGLTNDGKKDSHCSSGEVTTYSLSEELNKTYLKLGSSVHRDNCGGKERPIHERLAKLALDSSGNILQTIESAKCDDGRGVKTWVLKRTVL